MDLTSCKADAPPAAGVRTRPLALAAGVAAPPIFAAGVVAAAAAYPGYGHLTQAISELAVAGAPSFAIQTANFVVTGALLTLFGAGLSRRPGWLAGGLLIAAFGAGIVIQAFAPCDAGCNFVTTTGSVHNVVGLAGFLAAIAAVWLQGRSAAPGAYRRFSRLTAAAASAGFGAWIAIGKVAAVPAANGSLQRLFVGVLLVWCAVTAVRELRRERQEASGAPGGSVVTSATAAVARGLLALAFLLMAPASGAAQDYAAGMDIPFTPASPASVLSFLLIVGAVVGAAISATFVAARREAGAAAARRITGRFAIGVTLWLGLFSVWVASGILRASTMPFVPVTFVVINGAAVVFALSAAGGRLARQIPLAALVAFQGFRLPLEMVLHAWGEQGTIPMSMTWEGSNVDVVTGVAALVLAPFAQRPWVAWVANVIGSVLLVNVGRVALLSSPVPFGWDVEPKLMLVAHLPYAYVGAVCVAGALAGHVILTRKLVGAGSSFIRERGYPSRQR